MKQLINPEKFNISIEIALSDPPDAQASVKQLKRIMNNLPEGTLQMHRNGRYVNFYRYSDGHAERLKKTSDILYHLARKRYVLLLIQILELTDAGEAKTIRREKLIRKLQNLILSYSDGNLDIARIVLTAPQYRWYTSKYRRKKINLEKAQFTANGLPTRSKSEKDISNGLDELATVFHYEEPNFIYVRPLVEQLEAKLREEGQLKGRLFYYEGGVCIWRVPPELQWMNTRGSIWRTYNSRTGKILIHNDYKFMLANTEIMMWEHEGMYDRFDYRCNANERTGIMKFTGSITEENLITTYESDVNTPEKISEIIKTRILPGLWF